MKISFIEHVPEHYDYPQLSIFDDRKKCKNSIVLPNASEDRIVMYIHIPFCKGMCIFCNYYKELYDEKVIDLYVDYLIKEINFWGKCNDEEITIEAIHFGGGTPSALGGVHLHKIINSIKDTFILAPNCLISIESSIKDLSNKENVQLLIEEIPECRISFGVQTLNDALRRMYGLPTIDMFFKTVENLKKYGVQDYNADLMYGFPEQKVNDVIKDVNVLFGEGINAIDLHGLIVFPGTYFEKKLKNESKYEAYLKAKKEYLPLFEYLSEQDDINFVMSNTISKRMKTPNSYIKYHLGGNDIKEKGYVIGVGTSSRGLIGDFAYKNCVDLSGYIKTIDDQGWAVSISRQLNSYEEAHRKAVMFPNFMSIHKKAMPDMNDISSTLSFLIEEGWIIEGKENYYIQSKNGYWAGNISAMFYSREQRIKMADTVIKNLKNQLNMYNQDKMLF